MNIKFYAMKTLRNVIEQDGSIIFNIAIFNRFSSIGDGCYSDICGSFIDGVYQWSDHNIDFVDECENEKYVGYTITFNGGGQKRVYIEKWVLAIKPKNFKHARALFNKYLRSDEKFNAQQMIHSDSYGY